MKLSAFAKQIRSNAGLEIDSRLARKGHKGVG